MYVRIILSIIIHLICFMLCGRIFRNDNKIVKVVNLTNENCHCDAFGIIKFGVKNWAGAVFVKKGRSSPLNCGFDV